MPETGAFINKSFSFFVHPESVGLLGDNVQVTIVDIRGDKVRLGIVAPSEIPVHRKEVYDAIQEENRKAAGAAPEDLAEITTQPRHTGKRPRR